MSPQMCGPLFSRACWVRLVYQGCARGKPGQGRGGRRPQGLSGIGTGVVWQFDVFGGWGCQVCGNGTRFFRKWVHMCDPLFSRVCQVRLVWEGFRLLQLPSSTSPVRRCSPHIFITGGGLFSRSSTFVWYSVVFKQPTNVGSLAGRRRPTTIAERVATAEVRSRKKGMATERYSDVKARCGAATGIGTLLALSITRGERNRAG